MPTNNPPEPTGPMIVDINEAALYVGGKMGLEPVNEAIAQRVEAAMAADPRVREYVEFLLQSDPPARPPEKHPSAN